MNDMTECMEVKANQTQNAKLALLFSNFYDLEADIRLEKSLFVTKSSYDRTLRASIRQRTPFEPDKPFKERVTAENPAGLDVLRVKITFTFPSNRVLTLIETLTEPNGLTKSVELADSDGTSCTYEKFIEAEGEVVSRYLADKGEIVGNSR